MTAPREHPSSSPNSLHRPAARPLRITVVGAGHVGLVSAVSLATIGHRLRVLDVDAARIDALRGGETPFVEPYLPEFLRRTIARGDLTFHTDAEEASAGADVVFICVGTPNLPDGSVDMRGLIDATRSVASYAPSGCAIVSRSTAPVGTASYLHSLVAETRGDDDTCVAVNPEFLAEGTAIRDFLFPDRIVIGATTPKAVARVREAYEPIISRSLPTWLPAGLAAPSAKTGDEVAVVVTDPPTAELTKYAANAFLAVRISFINEIAMIAEEMGADVTRVAHAIGLDPRIGPHFLAAGVGWGGSCFPKDIVALQGMAQTRGVQARMLQAANDINVDQRSWVRRQLQRHLRTLVGRRVGLLGLAFKANTDDLRHAPALEIAAELAVEGVRVRAYDPAVTSLPGHLADAVEIVDGPLAAAQGAEAIVVVTDWPEFRAIDLDALRSVMRVPLLLDGRNGLDRARAEEAGFTYVGVGRPVAGLVTLERSVNAAADV